MSFPYVIGKDFISICLPDKAPQVIQKSNEIFSSLLEALTTRDFDKVEKLLDPKQVKNYFKRVYEEVYMIDGKNCTGKLGEVIIQHYKAGLPHTHLLAFFKKLQKNPSYRVVTQLYDFIDSAMSSGGFSITEDGNVIAYKKVREDYYDIYSRKIHNGIGKTIFVNRNEVNEDPEQVCAAGLHFAAFSYLEHYRSNSKDTDRILIVEIDPADIVAIPTDYSNAKGRCCKYKVIGEIKGNYKIDEKEYIKQPPVINKTIPPTQQIRTTDNLHLDGVSFEALVKQALAKQTPHNTQNSPVNTVYESMRSEILRELNKWDRAYLEKLTNSKLITKYSAVIYGLKIKGFNVPQKFRDKQTGINRLLELKRYINSHKERYTNGTN